MIQESTSKRSPYILLAIGWAVLSLIVAVLVIINGILLGFVAFNGCQATNGNFRSAVGMGWLVVVWPLAVIATALAPPLLLGMRRVNQAVAVFFLGCLAIIALWIAYLGVGYWAFC